MYSLVLMMTLGGGETPAMNPDYVAAPDARAQVAINDSRAYRGLRGGCRGGCHGSSYGCHGSYSHGCSGGYAHGGYSCHGGYAHGGHGCNGGHVYSGHGCNGGHVYSGHGCNGGRVSYYQEAPMVAPAQPERVPEPKPGQAQVPQAAPALIVVNVPADATVSIDDNPTQSTSAQRTFRSPPLEPGQVYHYTLKMEVTRDGQTVSDSKRIEVRAGQQTAVTFDVPSRVAQR